MTPTPTPLRSRSNDGDHNLDPVADDHTVVTEPALRRDAARNRAKILAAARALFDEEGVDVGVEVIAQRAGVGIGTLYRRFPTKELLIEAVVAEVLEAVLSAADAALENESASDGLAEYLRAVGRLQFKHAGCLTRLWGAAPGDVRVRLEGSTRELLSRAQDAGAVRRDLVYEDVVVLLWSLRGVIESTSTVSADAWLRHLELLLCALPPTETALQPPPLSAEQIERAKAAVALRDSLAGTPSRKA